ncbi:hypothetical protein JTE90_009653, partial [Oedothorax gibbosus]
QVDDNVGCPAEEEREHDDDRHLQGASPGSVDLGDIGHAKSEPFSGSCAGANLRTGCKKQHNVS